MKRVENSGEEPAEKQEKLGEKLRKEALLVGKRGGHTTPVLPSWRLLQFSSNVAAGDGGYNYSLVKNFPPLSARKLAATLWELDHYNFPVKMHQGVGGSNSRPRRHRQQQQHDPSPSSPDQPESAGSLRRHVAASLMQHQRSVQRSRAIQPVLPASYESSMEVTPYNPAVTPTSSVDLNGGNGETSYSLKTSTELLKVLNRIWSLEEQHASNIALVRALKKELDHARGKIKELVRDQQADRHEMDVLMKQIAEDKLDRKSKEHDRVNAAIQSVRDELEDERKLRRRSESLHRKLAKDLYEVKSSLSNALKDLDRERKSRKLLEDLCDEFALGIRDYEQEVHGLKQKSEKNWVDRADRDRSILHISESWLDERIQMKQESQIGIGEKKSIVDKFTAEIEAYLRSKHDNNRKNNQDVAPNDRNLRRSSLESIPLNVAVSAPQDDGDDDDSAGSDSHCFELDKPSTVNLKPENFEADNIDPNLDALHAKKKLESQDRNKGRHPSNLQVKFEEQMARAISRNGIKGHADDKEPGETEDAFPVEVNTSKKYETHAATEVINEQNNQAEGLHESSSNYIDNLVRSHYLLSENGNVQPDDRLPSGDSAAWRTRASPVRQWTSKLPPRELEISESSSKLPSDSKENTLKEKLLEARTRGQRSRSRLKGSNFLFRL